MRVRSFYHNDAQLYCTYDYAKQEFIRVMLLHLLLRIIRDHCARSSHTISLGDR